ncbi:NUDIX domain-containing protein [Paenibacillus flagellatus]|uniref:DNA mismatch repair protein MutT n=1 Tax=Paenibacillus flagellatus TaxID=2211139 RepID=A0A2V5JXL7_9BACL|nr:NUDIX domain-containing protein [Paenibacillus flagellatus]PYI51012.1 DNA mismatch repair protein MutT [Paenibacillus flagellatus]
MSITFRHIARALIIDRNRMLVVRMKGAHSFLPGGGVELGEGAEAALKRELREELGVTSCDIVRFLGVVEFGMEENHYHEINHLFEVRCDGLTSDAAPPSAESHLEFYWIEPTVEELRRHNVLPFLVQDMIPRLLSEGKPLFVSNMGE